ncbi:hypothetical protein, partial [Pseudomonas syringae group genomosp. 7]|uniref:hypothetical protein n=1 Tax=Pseudomonas syringae group genomosp. 7 TaxID=251699 RepID=UPI00376FAA3D
GASLKSRVLARPAMLLALAPLPLAVGFVSKDKSYSSSLVGDYTKNGVLLAGRRRKEKTNARTKVAPGLNRCYFTEQAN